MIMGDVVRINVILQICGMWVNLAVVMNVNLCLFYLFIYCSETASFLYTVYSNLGG